MRKSIELLLFLVYFLTSITTIANPSTINSVKVDPKIKWIYLIKAPEAEISRTQLGHYQLIIKNLNQTDLFMFNDRPFYLIRQFTEDRKNLWEGFTQSNYQPNKTLNATLIIGEQATEIFLSHLQIKNQTIIYDIKSAEKMTSLKPTKGSVVLFVSADSKPLCNMMNELKHNQLSLKN
jgi:hypothetical protein